MKKLIIAVLISLCLVLPASALTVIFEVPANTTFDTLTEEQQQAVLDVNGQWTADVMPGTQPVDGLKLISCYMDQELSVVEQWLVESTLPWEILTAVDGYKFEVDAEGNKIKMPNSLKKFKENKIRPYLAPVIIFDEDGNPISSEPPVDMPVLNTYQGQPAFEGE